MFDKGPFQYYENESNHQWYWRLVEANGRIVGDSAEGYNSKYNVERAIDNVIELINEWDWEKITEEHDEVTEESDA